MPLLGLRHLCDITRGGPKSQREAQDRDSISSSKCLQLKATVSIFLAVLEKIPWSWPLSSGCTCTSIILSASGVLVNRVLLYSRAALEFTVAMSATLEMQTQVCLPQHSILLNNNKFMKHLGFICYNLPGKYQFSLIGGHYQSQVLTFFFT